MRLLDVLPNFPFTTSKTMYNIGIYAFPHELPNDLILKILGNCEVLGNCLNSIEWQLSAKSPCQNNSFVNTSRKLLKNRT